MWVSSPRSPIQSGGVDACESQEGGLADSEWRTGPHGISRSSRRAGAAARGRTIWGFISRLKRNLRPSWLLRRREKGHRSLYCQGVCPGES
jgi:hypothetical protein